MRKGYSISSLVLLASALLLSACGSSGGGSGTTATPNTAPTAAFSADASEGVAPATVSFDASESSDSDGSISSYSWDFGDGASSSGVGSSHTYSMPGSYSVALTVTDDDGETDTTAFTITIAATATLSGTISINGMVLVDSDTNDGDSVVVSNNEAASAQPIPGVGTIGGFVTESPTYQQDDNFASVDDVLDAYRVLLSAGQTVSMTIADFDPTAPLSVDLDLYLLAASDINTVAASSLGIEQVESLTVPADNEYYIVVVAYNGKSNYTLSTNAAGVAMAAGNTLRLEDEFVAGEVVATLTAASAKQALAKPGGLRNILASMGLQQEKGSADGPLLLHLDTTRQAQKGTGGTTDALDGRYGFSMSTSQREAYETIKVLKQLRASSDVATADLNYIRHTMAAPNDDYYPYQWHYPLINLPLAWDLEMGNSAVVVAVVDTGVALAHPDLSANLTSSGYDFVSDTAMSHDGDGIDADPDDPGDSFVPTKSSFHGTHVAGTVAAVSNNGVGVAGVAPGVRVMPVRAMGIGGGTSYDVLQGIRYATGLANDSGTTPSTPADIINLSLGGSGYSETEQAQFNEVRNAGVMVVAAAGNDGTSNLFYPASYDGVISVSAVDAQKALAPYSNHGSAIDVAAPGGDSSADTNNDGYPDGVLSTTVDYSSGSADYVYSFADGTSMAAPHMAGVLALMKSAYPTLSPADVDGLIAAGLITQDLQGDGETVRNDSFGYGMIDALKAVQQAVALSTGGAVPSLLGVSPTTAGMVGSDTLELTLTQYGDTPLMVESVSSSESWASLAPSNVDANGLGSYLLTIDRSQLADGVYTLVVTFTAVSGTSTSATISVYQSSVTYTPDAGLHYVVLVDAVSGDTVAYDSAAAVAGQYSYRITGVPAGEYYLTTGSDYDNDQTICDPGEACGLYPDSMNPELVTVSKPEHSLDFTTAYGGTAQLGTQSVASIPQDKGDE